MDSIQRFILENKNEMLGCYGLFYKGEKRMIVEEQTEKYMILPQYSFTDFCTYFNSFSYKKWINLTALSNLELNLQISGKCIIRLVGFNHDKPDVEKNILSETNFENVEKTFVKISVPNNSCQIVGIEIETLLETILFSGEWKGEFHESREVNLSICTTTCRKEEYIKRNAKAIYDELFHFRDDISEHVFLHVVDNGNTLTESDFPAHKHILLHPNHNTGGAGGFARGMIESLHQKESITHVLLMDDDVIIEPESIRRTYILLVHLLEKHHKKFISGAMLYMERPMFQKEDVGHVSEKGQFFPWKPEFNLNDIACVIDNEKEIPLFKNSYAAWWYCCIPIETIKENGLPLPVFVRGDDIEYGNRCHLEFITMNSLCVWHMGFTGKLNIGMDYYQVNRNLLIAQSVSGVLKNVDIIFKIKRDFKHHLMRFDYESAEITISALEDYLKGPEFLKIDQGEKILKRNNALSHSLVSLAGLGDPDWGDINPFVDYKPNYLRRLLFRLTWNGHIMWPSKLYYKKSANIPYFDCYLPEKISFRTKLIAINVFNRTGYILERNNRKGRELLKRYHNALRKYKRDKEILVNAYAKEKEYLTSEKFWREYLEI